MDPAGIVVHPDNGHRTIQVNLKGFCFLEGIRISTEDCFSKTKAGKIFCQRNGFIFIDVFPEEKLPVQIGRFDNVRIENFDKAYSLAYQALADLSAQSSSANQNDRG